MTYLNKLSNECLHIFSQFCEEHCASRGGCLQQHDLSAPYRCAGGRNTAHCVRRTTPSLNHHCDCWRF